jgi:YihY family inner membrane protein
VSDALANQTGQGGVGLIGVVVATWGALKIFRGLDRAFSKVYGTDGGGIVEQVTDGVVALVGIGVGVAAVTVAGTVVALAPIPFSGLIASLVLLTTLFVAFLPLYYVYPDVDVTVREVLPGTTVAAVGWTLLGAGFGIYADYAASEGTAALYGVLGAVLLLVTYFYLAGLVLLSGAVVNAVLAGRTPDRTVAGGARTAGDGDDSRATAGADAAGSTDDSGVHARRGTGARAGAGAGTGAATDADDGTVGDSGG